MAKKNQLTKSDYLDYSEYRRLLDCLHSDREYFWEMFATLSFCTACRASDVLSLKWGDILNKSRVTITERKTGKTREIKITPSTQSKIQQLYVLMKHPEKRDYVFAIRESDKPITIQCVNQNLKFIKHKYRLNINHFSTHTFRKTFGRYVYESSGRSAESLVLLNTIFKHTSIQITKAYIGITQTEIDKIFESIQL